MKNNSKVEPTRIGILGFGREGKSTLKYLRQSSQFKKAKIEILDQKNKKNYLEKLARFDLIFRSPGIPHNLPELKKAREDGVYFSSVTKLFFENYKGKVIGITGTKGKGTTSTLLYQMLKSSGKKALRHGSGQVFLAGNIGKSAVDSLLKYGDYPLAVLELSSFQLQDLDVSPAIAVILDVFPDHQDVHTNLKEYYEAKANIGLFQKKADKIFFFKDNKNSLRLAMKSPAKKFPVDYREFKSFKPEDLKVKGIHNFRNAVMAAEVAASLGVDLATIKSAAKKFKGLEHRLEFVRKISEVSFYNDSASTNPHTTAAALLSFPGENKILIAGGRSKVDDYKPVKAACNSETKFIILIGENKNKIKQAIRTSGVPIRLAKTLADAVKFACAFSKTLKYGNVIFSPGSASFDSFRDYADRGKKFKGLVAKLEKNSV